MAVEPNTSLEPDQATITGWTTYEAKGLGTLWLVWEEQGLRSLSFWRPDVSPALEKEMPGDWRRVLDRYFAGEASDLNALPVQLQGTEFQKRVWEALRGIPYGAVRSYESIANEVGSPKAMRAVGMANHVNPVPIVVPCHRVIEAGHHLGGYGGGVERKRFLLELEGAQIEGSLVRPGQLSLF